MGYGKMRRSRHQREKFSSEGKIKRKKEKGIGKNPRDASEKTFPGSLNDVRSQLLKSDITCRNQ